MSLSNRSIQSNQEEPKYPSLNALLTIINKHHGVFSIANDGKDVLGIRFNKDGSPVRILISRSNYRKTNQLFSKKTKLEMSSESPIEYKGSYILETTPEIEFYQMQPAVISYRVSDDTHRHIPDALVKFTNGTSCFIEFKAESYLDDEDLIKRTEILSNNLPAHGYGYLVVCEEQVSGIPLENAMILFHAQKTKIPQTLMMDLKKMFDCKTKITICTLLGNFSHVPQIKNNLYQLMLSGTIGYDNEKLINSDSEIYWKGTTR